MPRRKFGSKYPVQSSIVPHAHLDTNSLHLHMLEAIMIIIIKGAEVLLNKLIRARHCVSVLEKNLEKKNKKRTEQNRSLKTLRLHAFKIRKYN